MSKNNKMTQEEASEIIADPTLVIDYLAINKQKFSGDDIKIELSKAVDTFFNFAHTKYPENFRDIRLSLYKKNKVDELYNVVLTSKKLVLNEQFADQNIFSKANNRR